MWRFHDGVLGGLAIAAGAAVLTVARGFPEMPGEPGPALFPVLAALGLVVCGAVLVVEHWRAGVPEVWMQTPDWLRRPRAAAAVAFIVAALAFCSVSMETVGFLPCAVVLVTGLLALLKVRWPVAVTVGVVSALVVHTIFHAGLRVALPWGLIERFAW